MKQRWYKVVFETIERKPIRRTVTVCSTDSVHASTLVYPVSYTHLTLPTTPYV